jgi:uncharacterized protein
MLIGVVSDSHGRVEYTLAAVRMLESLDVAAVLHCGDIGSAEIVRLFAPWPTHFVFGNVDYNEGELTNAIKTAGQTCHGQFGSRSSTVTMRSYSERQSTPATTIWSATATRM